MVQQHSPNICPADDCRHPTSFHIASHPHVRIEHRSTSTYTISEVPLGADLAGGLDWDAWVRGLEEDGAALCDSEAEGPGLSRPNKVPATELCRRSDGEQPIRV